MKYLDRPRLRTSVAAASALAVAMTLTADSPPAQASCEWIDLGGTQVCIEPDGAQYEYDDWSPDASGDVVFVTSPGAVRGRELAAQINLEKLDPAVQPGVGSGGSDAAHRGEGNELGSDAIATEVELAQQRVREYATAVGVDVSQYDDIPMLLLFPVDQFRSPRAPDQTGLTPDNAADSDRSGLDPINPANGEFVLSNTDLRLPGKGIPFVHRRSYRSRVDFDGPLGFGWDHSYNKRLVRLPPEGDAPFGDVMYSTGAGTTLRFRFATSSVVESDGLGSVVQLSYTSPAGVHVMLTGEVRDTEIHDTVSGLGVGMMASGFLGVARWTLTEPTGIRATFDHRGLLVRIADPNGNEMLLTWDAATETAHGVPLLTQVVDTAGREIAYSYDTSGRLTRVEELESGLYVEYGYAGDDLAFARSYDGRIERYEYENGWADETPDYVPEPYLQHQCPTACGGGGDGDGACAGAAEVGIAHCINSAEYALASCTEECGSVCAQACTHGPDDGTAPGCNAACGDVCADEASMRAICDEIYGDAWFATMWEGDSGLPPSVICDGCEDECRTGCGYSCQIALLCVFGGGTLGDGSEKSEEVEAKLAELGKDIGVCELFSLDMWEKMLHEAWALLTGLTEDVVECIAGLFELEWSCDLDSVDESLRATCMNPCIDCCADGSSCGAGSCNAGASCASECRKAFYGDPLASTCTSGGPLGGSTEGCVQRVSRDCSFVCPADCRATCEPPCRADCREGCIDAIGLRDEVGDPSFDGWIAECESRAGAFVLECQAACVDSCFENGRVDGVARYGYERDLNHNLTRVRDGSGEVVIFNTYEHDVTSPAFDRVTRQDFGGHETALHYRDLRAERQGVTPGPIAGSPGQLYIDSLASYKSVEICPDPCTTEPFYPPPGNTTVVTWGDTLVTFVDDPGRGDTTSARVVSDTDPSELSLLVLRVEATREGTLAIPISDEPLALGGLVVEADTAVGSLVLRDQGWSGLLVEGDRVTLDRLESAGNITLITDDTGTLHVRVGRPHSLASVVSGRCSGVFRATPAAGGAEISPPDACTDNLVLAPLASHLNVERALTLYSNEDGRPTVVEDTFRSTALVPTRAVVKLDRSTEKKFIATSGPALGSAPPSQLEAAARASRRSPSLRASAAIDATSGTLERPAMVFHVPTAPILGDDVLEPIAPIDPVPPDPDPEPLPPAQIVDPVVIVDDRDFDEPQCWSEPPAAERWGTGTWGPGLKPTSATAVVDPYGVAWTFYYDSMGRTLKSINHGTNAARHYDYDLYGQLTGIREPLGGRSCNEYDDVGNVVQTTYLPAAMMPGTSSPIMQRMEFEAGTRRVSKIFDPRNPALALTAVEYDERGNVVSVSNALGETTHYTPSSHGPPTEVTGADGAVARFAYDDFGALSSQVFDAEGDDPASIVFEYDSVGRLISQTDSRGLSLAATWDKVLPVTATATGGAMSSTQSIAYSVDALPQRLETPLVSVEFEYSATKHLVSRAAKSKADASSVVECFGVGPRGLLLTSVDPDGHRITLERDGEGRVVSARVGEGSAHAHLLPPGWDSRCAADPNGSRRFSGSLWRRELDANGQVASITNSLGETRRLVRDGFGRIIETQEPDGTVNRVGYDALGNATWVASYEGLALAPPYRAPQPTDSALVAAAEYEYDGAGRLTLERRWQFPFSAPWSDGIAETVITRDVAARTTTVTDDAGNDLRTVTDGLGRVVEQILPTGDFVAIGYRDSGLRVERRWSSPTPSGIRTSVVTMTPWGAPELIETADTGAPVSFARFEYDAFGRQVSSHDLAAGQSTTREYDAFGRVTATEYAYGTTAGSETVERSFSPAGRLLFRTSRIFGRDPQVTSLTYDELGRVASRTDPDGAETISDYVGISGRIASVTDARGVETVYDYGPGGAVETATAYAPDGGFQQRVFEYDAVGRPTAGELRDPSGVVVRSELDWDSLSNRLREHNTLLGGAGDVTTTFDALGNPRRQELGVVAAVERRYDELGRLTDASLVGGATGFVDFSYDGLGGPVTRRTGGRVTSRFEYDALARLTGIDDSNLAGVLSQWDWAIPRDGVPRVASHSRFGAPSVSSVFEVGSARRLVAEGHGVAKADHAIGASSSADAANDAIAAALKFAPEWSRYALDARHNWVRRTSDDANRDVSPIIGVDDRYLDFNGEVWFDEQGAVVSAPTVAVDYDLFGQPARVTTDRADSALVYDAFGRMVEARDLRRGTVEHFGYDGARRAMRRRGDGTVEAVVTGDGIDQLLLRVDDTGEVLYYHQDRQGSPYLITDAYGEPVEWYSFSAYGEMRIFDARGVPQKDSAISNRFGFQGHPQDAATGIVDMRARLYYPQWGRFLAKDPLGFSASSNPYAFVDSAPLAYVDRFGLDSSISAGVVPGADCGQWSDAGFVCYDGYDGKDAIVIEDTAQPFGRSTCDSSSFDCFEERYGTEFAIVDGTHYIRNNWQQNFHLVGRDVFHQTRAHNINLEGMTPEQAAALENASAALDEVQVVGVVYLGTLGGVFAVGHFGATAVGVFILEEGAEYAVETITGIPVIVGPEDLIEWGIRRGGRELAEEVGEQALKHSDELVEGAEAGAKIAARAGTRTFDKLTDADVARIADVRASLGVGGKRNIAVADGHVNGVDMSATGVSGAKTPGVSAPATRRFDTSEVGGFSREFDSEVLALERIAENLAPSSRGTIRLISERAVCASCASVISQFEAAFPGVTVIVRGGR